MNKVYFIKNFSINSISDEISGCVFGFGCDELAWYLGIAGRIQQFEISHSNAIIQKSKLT